MHPVYMNVYEPHSSSVRSVQVSSFMYEDTETLRSNGAQSQWVGELGFEPRQSSAQTNRDSWKSLH